MALHWSLTTKRRKKMKKHKLTPGKVKVRSWNQRALCLTGRIKTLWTSSKLIRVTVCLSTKLKPFHNGLNFFFLQTQKWALLEMFRVLMCFLIFYCVFTWWCRWERAAASRTPWCALRAAAWWEWWSWGGRCGAAASVGEARAAPSLCAPPAPAAT